jgi:MFS family permease
MTPVLSLAAWRRTWPALGVPALLLVLTLANGLNGLALSGLGEVLPTLHRTWHAGYDGLGLALGLLRCASFLGALYIGPRIDRLPARPLMVGVGAVFALSWALLPLAGSLAPATLIFVLIGASAGAQETLLIASAPRLWAAAPAGANALLSVAFILGSALGPLAGLATAGATGGGFALSVAVCSLPLLLATARLAPAALTTPGPVEAVHAAGAPSGGCLERATRTDLALLAALMFLYIGVEVGFGTWIFTLLSQSSGAGVALAAAVPLLFWLATGAGALYLVLAPMHGWRTPTLHSLPAAALLTAGVLGTVALSGHLLVALLAAPLMGAAQGPQYALLVARALALCPAAAGRISGVLTAANYLGAMALPTLVGLLMGQGRLAASAPLIAASLALALLARRALRSPACAVGDRVTP